MSSKLARTGRVVRLTLSHVRMSLSKFVLLALSISIGFLVFMAVSALSIASGGELESAITSDLGELGTYSASVQTSSTRSAEVAHSTVSLAMAGHSNRYIILADYGLLSMDCPSLAVTSPDSVHLFLLLERSVSNGQSAIRSGKQQDRPTSANQICIGGATQPTSVWPTVALPSAMTGGQAFLVAPPGMASELRIQIGPPNQVTAVFVTGRADDQGDAVTAALDLSLSRTAGAKAFPVPVVIRLDDGGTTRNAASGVRLVYGLIGWSVLSLGGIGLLVAQLMGAKARIWFFGLTRVLGATSYDLAVIVVTEVAIIVATGSGIAVGIAIAVGPAISRWANGTFGESVNLLAPTVLRQLGIGSLFVGMIGAVLPALRAVRCDPLTALEARAS